MTHEPVRSNMADIADRATEETAASEDTGGAEAPTCVVRNVEPMGAPRDATGASNAVHGDGAPACAFSSLSGQN